MDKSVYVLCANKVRLTKEFKYFQQCKVKAVKSNTLESWKDFHNAEKAVEKTSEFNDWKQTWNGGGDMIDML